MRSPTPHVVLIYGLLGVIPFLAPPVVGAMEPAVKPIAAIVLAVYGALILSFLGGARWGLANAHRDPSAPVITVAMVPTLVGLVLLILPAELRWLQLIGVAAALALHWLWDVSAANLPDWYPRLRTILTAGAVTGLVAGWAILT